MIFQHPLLPNIYIYIYMARIVLSCSTFSKVNPYPSMKSQSIALMASHLFSSLFFPFNTVANPPEVLSYYTLS